MFNHNDLSQSPEKIHKEQDDDENDNFIRKQLEKSIKEFEATLSENKFKSFEERSELETLVQTLKKKLQNLDGLPLKTPNKKQLSIAPTILDINEMRRRGIQEIFDFYSKQHIP